MRTTLVVRQGIMAIGIDDMFFSTILGFTSRFVHKHYNKYTSQKVVNSNNPNKIHLKCDLLDGSVVNGSRQPIIFSFVINKPSGYKVFCEHETIH